MIFGNVMTKNGNGLDIAIHNTIKADLEHAPLSDETMIGSTLTALKRFIIKHNKAIEQNHGYHITTPYGSRISLALIMLSTATRNLLRFAGGDLSPVTRWYIKKRYNTIISIFDVVDMDTGSHILNRWIGLVDL